ncbi:MAG: hypothetical protein ABIZ70_11060 [Gemmatimonadales bacterium]
MRVRVEILLALLAVPTVLPAQGAAKHGSDVSIAVRASTLGFGAEISKLLIPHVGVRLGANTYSLTKNVDQSDVTFDAKLKMKALTALIDLYPAGRGSFHLTGGLITNPVEITAVGQPNANGSYKINGRDYTAAQVGTLTGTGKWPKTSPYAGLGFGTPANSHKGIKFIFDLGAAVSKSTIALTATGGANSAQLQSDINAQVAKTQKDIDKYAKVYPVLSFGLAFRF